MALTRKGSSDWILTAGGSKTSDRYGLSQASARWVKHADTPGPDPTSFGTAHPYWGDLKCDKVVVSQTEVGWEATAEFYGIVGSPVPIYELDLTSAEEPIETHPRFEADIGGKLGATKHGAKFDPDGLFLGFSDSADPADSLIWRGVRGYLTPGAVWRVTSVTNIQPGGPGDIGKIDTPPGTVSTPSGMNWLYTGLTYEQRGYSYTVKQEWRLSGRRGWNTTIYT